MQSSTSQSSFSLWIFSTALSTICCISIGLLLPVNGFIGKPPAYLSSTHWRAISPRAKLWQLPSTASSNSEKKSPFEILQSARVIDPRNGKECSALDGLFDDKGVSIIDSLFGNNQGKNGKQQRLALVVIMPQLGDFDTFEYAEFLTAVKQEMEQNSNIRLRIIGIGDAKAGQKFARFCNIDTSSASNSSLLCVDPTAAIHRTLKLHEGPNWDIPTWVPRELLIWFAKYTKAINESKSVDDMTIGELRSIARAWLNYMAMCAGIAAPDTLPEIIRGYIGDKSAPERLGADETVVVGDDLIRIKGVTDVKLGPIKYQSLWKNEVGYQRPAELATVRLRGMVEVLSNLNEYVPDQEHLALRGATYIFDESGKILYEHRDTGVLAYSSTMPRPLSFLEPYIGNLALNPLRLGDQSS